jgi:hypothetical protein
MIRRSAALANAELTSLKALIDAAASAGKIEIYDGATVPEETDPVTDTLLCTLALQYPCGSVSARVLTLALPIQGLVLVDGTAKWCRLLDGDDEVVFIADVGLTASDTWLRLPSLALVAGQQLTIADLHEITA